MNVTARPAGRQSHEVVYQSIRKALMSGDLLPGERLVVSRLAQRFSTSTMPVRQALHKLAAEQALVEWPNRGAEVPRLTVADLMDLRRVRCAIEGTATEWATRTITEAELAELRELQARMRATRDASKAQEYLGWNLRFHFIVYAAARSPLILPIIESLWLRVGPCLNYIRTEATLGMGLDAHDRLIVGLTRGDAAAARAAVEEDLTGAAEVIARAFGSVTLAPPRPGRAARS